MALLTEKERKEYFEYLGYEYSAKGIKKIQKDYLRSKDVDGIYGQDTDNLVRHLYNVKKYTKNFKPEEFKCECGGKYCCGYPSYMKPIELQHIQKIRDIYGKPIIVTCGMRCKTYNSKCSGSIQNSLHLTGYAIDFYQQGVTDTLSNRKKSIKTIKTLPNHHYTYGDGINSNGYAVNAPYMGNALHTDTQPSVAPTPAPDPDKPITVDGIGGPATVAALQKLFSTTRDGVVSGQNKSLRTYYPALKAVEYGKGGSALVKKLQAWAGVSADGIWGKETSKAMQRKLGVAVDGIFGGESMKALQRYVNAQLFPDTPKDDKKEEQESSSDYLVIDVSEFQKAIDWAKVKAAGIKGAIVRCGFRGYEKGTLKQDSMFLNHIKGAHAAGLKCGVYFFTEGINAAEGKEEAAYTLNLVKQAGIPLYFPIAIDTEHINAKNVRANDLSKAKRTEVIKAFCEEIKAQGYEPMIYASTSWFNNKLDMSKLPYKIWCAQYYSKCEYKGEYILWQYTSEGKVNGVSGVVDMNHCYMKEAAVVSEPTPVVATVAAAAPVVMAETAVQYSGALPTAEEIKAASREGFLRRCALWVNKIAGEKYHYVTWKGGDPKTKTCPVCNGRKYDDHFGWNCIGFSFAVWHHGGRLASKCNCHVVSNEIAEKILAAKTDAEALKIARNHIGIKDIEVIRNKSGIPKKQWKSGDICMQWKDGKYGHTFYYMGSDKIADSTKSGGEGGKNNIAVRNYKNYTAKVIFRWTGSFAWLQMGDKGEAVKKIQAALNAIGGYGLDTDGIWGDKTEAAVRDFQAKNGLVVDGEVGVKTLEKMKGSNAHEPAPAPAPAEPVKSGYTGELPTLALKKTNAEVIRDAIRWATWIAGDNTFHYGYGKEAHHNGCYFCGTEGKLKKGKGIVDYEHTYCCNPFVGAAWAHGGCVPAAMKLCRKCSSWDFSKGSGYDKSSLFDNLGHPAKSKLKAGDVLCRDTHVALYIGNGKIAEASGGDDNKRNSEKWNNSIHIKSLSDDNYKKFPRVHRFNSSVDTSCCMYHGEVSKRVELLQAYLNWYGTYGLAVDGEFGDKTLAAVKDFQAKQGIAVDGIVGPNTITVMGKVVR